MSHIQNVPPASRADRGLHLYYNARHAMWVINTTFAPDSNGALATMKCPRLCPPSGEHIWGQSRIWRNAPPEDEGVKWTQGPWNPLHAPYF